jgi:transcriptional regulator of acetoin/glycerol metabolism
VIVPARRSICRPQATPHRLTRIEAFEREEIIRVLTLLGTSMKDAARELGMSRATIYRKIAQYDLHLPKR